MCLKEKRKKAFTRSKEQLHQTISQAQNGAARRQRQVRETQPLSAITKRNGTERYGKERLYSLSECCPSISLPRFAISLRFDKISFRLLRISLHLALVFTRRAKVFEPLGSLIDEWILFGDNLSAGFLVLNRYR